MWIPLVLVGSVLYWTVALGLGGMSLSALGGGGTGEELANCPGSRSVSAVTLPSPVSQTREPIVVHIQSGIELQSQIDLATIDLTATGSGGNHALDDGTGRLPGIDEAPQPPVEDSVGRTSY
jgi:hypothetical protein